ncbi:MAG: Hpt domain-containing protein [Thermoanaerobaculia bacterium]
MDYELNELKREFLVEAQEKVRELQAALETVRSRESLERVAYIAHQLKGSGGSYGYQSISTDAAEIEKAVEAIGDKGAPDPRTEEKIQQHVMNLRVEIERRSAELATA